MYDLDTALGKTTGYHSSIHPKTTTMVAKKGENNIEPDKESPRLEGSNLDTGEGRTTVTST